MLHRRRLRRIPLRIAVTGTRGKSTVVRLVCAVLEANGRRVVGKTTGTEPCILLPDSPDEPVKRRGLVTILEQKKLVKRAVREGAESLVAEVMSLHEENHRAEAHDLLAPHIVVLTNVRTDHTEAMGPDEEAVARVLGRTIGKGSLVLFPASEGRAALVSAAAKAGARLQPVEPRQEDADPPLPFWPEQLALVRATGAAAGLDAATVQAGILEGMKAFPDPLIWRMRHDRDGGLRYLVDAFAANDPLSTDLLLHRVRDRLPDPGAPSLALLSLRPDRGGRTLQWISALAGPLSDRFGEVMVTGGHARAAARRIPGSKVLPTGDAVEVTRRAMDVLPPGGVVMGIGNHVGTAQRLLEYWRGEGDPHAL